VFEKNHGGQVTSKGTRKGQTERTKEVFLLPECSINKETRAETKSGRGRGAGSAGLSSLEYFYEFFPVWDFYSRRAIDGIALHPRHSQGWREFWIPRLRTCHSLPERNLGRFLPELSAPERTDLGSRISRISDAWKDARPFALLIHRLVD